MDVIQTGKGVYRLSARPLQRSGAVKKARTRKTHRVKTTLPLPSGSQNQRLHKSDVSSLNDPADFDNTSAPAFSRRQRRSIPLADLPGPLLAGRLLGRGAGAVGAGAWCRGRSGLLVGRCRGCFLRGYRRGLSRGRLGLSLSLCRRCFFSGVRLGSVFLQPLKVNATSARAANAVSTTLLMIIPFVRLIPLYCLPTFLRAKIPDTPVTDCDASRRSLDPSTDIALPHAATKIKMKS